MAAPIKRWTPPKKPAAAKIKPDSPVVDDEFFDSLEKFVAPAPLGLFDSFVASRPLVRGILPAVSMIESGSGATDGASLATAWHIDPDESDYCYLDGVPTEVLEEAWAHFCKSGGRKKLALSNEMVNDVSTLGITGRGILALYSDIFPTIAERAQAKPGRGLWASVLGEFLRLTDFDAYSVQEIYGTETPMTFFAGCPTPEDILTATVADADEHASLFADLALYADDQLASVFVLHALAGTWRNYVGSVSMLAPSLPALVSPGATPRVSVIAPVWTPGFEHRALDQAREGKKKLTIIGTTVELAYRVDVSVEVKAAPARAKVFDDGKTLTETIDALANHHEPGFGNW